VTADLKERHYGHCARCGITLQRHGAVTCGDCWLTDPMYVRVLVRTRRNTPAKTPNPREGKAA